MFFKLDENPSKPKWGGTRIYPYTSKEAPINAFTSFAKTAPFDPKAALILSFGYALGQWLSSTDVEYADPISSTDLPPIFSGFQTTIMDTTKVSYLADLTSQLRALNSNGLRETYWTATYRLNDTLAEFIAITTAMTSHMSQNGGNALGLSPEDGPLILLDLSIRWSNKSDDEATMRATANLLSKAAAQAKARGLEHRYLCMNYASEFQDMISSYGEENRQRLSDVARRYDPQGVFQRLQPKYFKLDGGLRTGL
ncbi:hypothetical protein VTN00DRAFT_2953 [Thermoascus crustaceus]|uniref:uncharacterized protein n=1 Tax=Thermoascus crustaceus TaxID=5088 RepID=UPI00374349CF